MQLPWSDSGVDKVRSVKKKLIEVALPLEAINKASAREKSIRHGHPSTLHLWWARRPLAAARAVIFSQMVDDPSSLPDLFPTEAKQQKERERLFRIIEDLVQWENTTNEAVLEKARAEIWQSWRRACAENADHPRAKELFDRKKLPAFHDPFAGGGALPLEAQRLGLEAYASDLNPVAVLICKAMIEIPPRFAGQPPVNPEARSEWREERSELDALPEDNSVAEGDGRRAGAISLGAETAARGDLRNAFADHAGGGLDSGEHRRGLDTRDGQGQSPFPGDRTGLLGRDGNAPDALRESDLVPEGRDSDGARIAGRGEPDAHSNASKTPGEVTSHSSLLFPRSYSGAEGLAEDVRYYGKWMRDEAEKRIGHLYPKVTAWRDSRSGRYFGEADVEEWRRSEGTGERSEAGEEAARGCGHPSLSSLLSALSSHKLTVIAWLWARTVKSPNPAFANVDVPLASTFMLSTKAGKEAYVEVEKRGERSEERESSFDDSLLTSPYSFLVRTGKPKDAERAKSGTKLSRGANFECLMSGTPIAGDYIKAEGRAGRMGARLMAIVAEGERGRVYLAPTLEHEAAARKAKPEWRPDVEFFQKALGFSVGNYGLTKWSDLFTPRQLVALTTLSDLVGEAMQQVRRDALEAGGHLTPLSSPLTPLRDGGTGAEAYAEAVGVYLAFTVDKAADYWSTICSWHSSRELIRNTFGRNAIPLAWDYAETNPFSASAGNAMSGVEWAKKAISRFPGEVSGSALQGDAQNQSLSCDKLVSTDPPYYDNIGYADLSDFFYVWLRRPLREVFPELFATLAVPKDEELVATPHRHGSRKKAETYFLDGMTHAMQRLAEQAHPAFPVTIYYAFKQYESDTEAGTSSTGWETFLDAVVRAGFAVSGTWPTRTELANRMRGMDSNALASSIVLVCRKRAIDAPTATRREFVAALKSEVPTALRHLQEGNIAPVDLAQAAIGPGMAVYTRYAKVLDAEGKPVPVREALALINQVLDETLAEQEGDFDADSRFAIAWFEQHGFTEGEFGVADVLARAKNTSVSGLAEAGILESKGGKVRLFKPAELPEDWDPTTDERLSHWETVHHLIRALDAGESAAAALVAKLGSKAETARELAYRLYTVCERKKRAAEALSYNALVQSFPEITRLAREGRVAEQATLFAETEE
jgi:putative DNA methylase